MAINPINIGADAVAYANARTSARVEKARQAALPQSNGSSALSEVSSKYSGQAREINRALSSANNGLALAQTAGEALGKVDDNLKKLRKLTEQASKEGVSAEDRGKLQKQADELLKQINKTVNGATYDKTKVLASNDKATFQTGVGDDKTATAELSDFSKTFGAVDLSSADAAKKSLGKLESAGEQVERTQQKLAQAESRFQAGVENLTLRSKGLSQSRALLENTDQAALTALDIGRGGAASFRSFGGIDANRLRALLGG